ncbi:hypothetical protein CC2G_001918 [Coprinopsis cinerea AmutBmut pab1-1]|nr:hypothetical protein CC2G_001918 [Coprinopsis cinerea AmutBmut pab1-1]
MVEQDRSDDEFERQSQQDTQNMLEEESIDSQDDSDSSDPLDDDQLALGDGARVIARSRYGTIPSKVAGTKRKSSEAQPLARPPRKKPKPSDQLVHHGHHFTRTIYAFSNIQALVIHGMAVENSGGGRPEDPQLRRAYRVYRKLLKLVPGLEERINDASAEELVTMCSLLQKGANNARANDTKSLKPAIIDWLVPPGEVLQPSLARNIKADRGFHHERTGYLLAPPGIDWGDDEIKRQLRDNELIVKAQDWPRFLWKDEVHNPEKPWEGFLQNDIIVKGFKHIFTSPSSVDKLPVATRAGNAKIHGMTSVNGPSLAYVATQIRFALSSEGSFVRDGNGEELEDFYQSILEVFEDPYQQDDAKKLLSWWNQQIFPAYMHKQRAIPATAPLASFRAYSAAIQKEREQEAAAKSTATGRRATGRNSAAGDKENRNAQSQSASSNSKNTGKKKKANQNSGRLPPTLRQTRLSANLGQLVN